MPNCTLPSIRSLQLKVLCTTSKTGSRAFSCVQHPMDSLFHLYHCFPQLPKNLTVWLYLPTLGLLHSGLSLLTTMDCPDSWVLLFRLASTFECGNPEAIGAREVLIDWAWRWGGGGREKRPSGGCGRSPVRTDADGRYLGDEDSPCAISLPRGLLKEFRVLNSCITWRMQVMHP